MYNLIDLTDRRILVIGASSGIGKSLVLLFVVYFLLLEGSFFLLSMSKILDTIFQVSNKMDLIIRND